MRQIRPYALYVLSRAGVVIGLALVTFGVLTNQPDPAWFGAASVLFGTLVELINCVHKA
jgi:hypothetical protein